MRSRTLTICVLLLTGCVPNTQYTVPPSQFNPQAPNGYRQSIRPCSALMQRAVDPQVENLCDLAILEFDDQGEFWEPAQLNEALDLVHEKSNPNQPALVVVFVHGWKNNASPQNERRGNLASFNEVLVDLTEDQLERCEEGEDFFFCNRPVVGVYMAWRGKTFSTPIGKSLSYFPRRAAAERVARVSFSHAIHRIVNHAKGTKSEDGNGIRKRGNQDSIVVMVGHSLGGLIVENTLLRSLTHETNNFREDFPVDLAVLVNSANDAIITRQFVHALEQAPPAPAPGGKLSLPLIVSVTSSGDWATRYLTPASQSVRRVGKSFRGYGGEDAGSLAARQLFYYKHTAAHSGPLAGLVSHEIRCSGSESGCEDVRASKKSSLQELSGKSEPDRDLFDPPAIKTGPCTREKDREEELDCIENLWFTGSSPGSLYEIRRIPGASNDTFYWVLQLPERIVPDHSRIFQSEFVSLMAALVTIRSADKVGSLAEAKELLLGEPEAEEVPEDRHAKLDPKAGMSHHR